MARTRHIGVLLVVATLLLWGSAAAATTSLSTGGGAVDTASTAQVQQQEENASVTFEDQTAENGTVTVANVTVPEGGYVTIHNDSLRDGDAVGSVVGVSEYLEPGVHENVSVTLYEGVEGADFENASEPTGTETLIAMPHQETSNQTTDNQTDGVGDNQTTTTDDGLNDTETTTDDGLNDTETTTDGGVNDTETTTTDDGLNDTTDDGLNDTDTTTEDGVGDDQTTDDGLNDTETTTEEGANDETSVNAQQQTQTNQTFDFVESDGQEDGPYTEDGEAVTDSAEVEFGEADEPDDDEDEADDEGAAGDDDEEADEAASNFTVSDLEAPALAGPNETVTVNATLSNTGDEEHSEDVAFRLAGDDADVVVYQSVSIDGDENETVTFDVNASDVGEGEYIHGVTTENSSAFANIEVTNESQVVFGDQAGDGENVTVESVYLPEGGYVAVHDDSLLDGDAVGSVVGVSEYLDAGVHENVSVTLYEDVPGADFEDGETTGDDAATEDDTATQDDATTQDNATLVAMAHMETTDNEDFEFVESEGEDDGPYTVDGEAVVDVGNLSVTVEDSPSGADEDPADN